jgi:hypothetical protein
MVVSHNDCHEDLIKYYSDYVTFTRKYRLNFDYDSSEAQEAI